MTKHQNESSKGTESRLNRLKEVVMRYWRRWVGRTPDVPRSGHNQPPPPAVIADRQPAAERAKDAEEAGRWYFRRHLLDRLSLYMDMAERLKKTNDRAYALYRHTGAAILPARAFENWQITHREDGCAHELSWRWKNPATCPSFGAVAYLDNLDKAVEEERLTLRMICFYRIERAPASLEPSSGGAVYEVIIFYHTTAPDARGKVGASDTNFFVELLPGGVIRPLRAVETKYQTIKHRNNRAKGRRTSVVAHRNWSLVALKWFSKQFKASPKAVAQMFFEEMAYGFEMASASLRITARRDGVNAVFGIDMLRTPHFFSDRDASALTASGRRRPIFHIVRTHAHRGTRTGYRRSHFRGLRHFEWNGYHVSISMPGKHHSPIADATFGALLYDDDEQMPKGTTEYAAGLRQIGKRLAA